MSGGQPRRLLDGVKVIDFTHIFAGPLATQALGDMGADVIKIERLGSGDAARTYGQGVDDDDMGGSFLALNRNKRSVEVDLKQAAGIELVRRLILSADVVVQNFRLGTLAKWGLDYDQMSAVKPELIYCSMTGFGHVGSMATKAANDLAVQAYSSLLSFTGEPGGGPVRCGTAIADFSAGLYATIGILGALIQRQRSGQGQHVHTSMLESQVSIMNYFFADYWLKGIVPKPLGTANRLGIPNQAFPTRDGWVVISNANESMWRRCCVGLGIPEVGDDPRFESLARRYENAEALIATVTAATSAQTTAECLAGLEAEGVSCAPVNSLDQVAGDPQLEAVGAFIEVPRGDGGQARVVATPVHYSASPLDVRLGVPTLGQHTGEVLRQLGLTDQELADLVAAGAIGPVEPAPAAGERVRP
ncbi:MAG: CoA transferase [Propionibacteriaceae bacterium]|jgi:crotonobetainyl-CoA:carnitine CoA-transferase CaiB-like acyl-CoA transferase|nr:CoA transferase [Propionibacteriaceae bacterium]